MITWQPFKEEPKHIGLKATNKAIQLVSYFYEHFQKVQRMINTNEDAVSSHQFNLLKAFSIAPLEGQDKREIVKKLLIRGYSNAEISTALEVPKNDYFLLEQALILIMATRFFDIVQCTVCGKNDFSVTR